MNAAQFILICDALSIWGNWYLFRIMRRRGAEPAEPTWTYFNAVESASHAPIKPAAAKLEPFVGNAASV